MKDDEPTPEELREAEALARALEGAPSESAPPPEALETAALLRHAHGGGQLDPARAQALAAKLRAEVRPRRRRWWWAVLVPVAVGTAGVMLFATTMQRRGPALPPLPAPGPAVLAAQAEAARGRPQALADLDAQMRAYRQALYARLREGER
jgi:hypothetical protein